VGGHHGEQVVIHVTDPMQNTIVNKALRQNRENLCRQRVLGTCYRAGADDTFVSFHRVVSSTATRVPRSTLADAFLRRPQCGPSHNRPMSVTGRNVCCAAQMVGQDSPPSRILCLHDAVPRKHFLNNQLRTQLMQP
jgi:hypothetical protein